MIDKKRNYNEGLTPKLIYEAISGVEDAQEKIFEHYEPYTIKLSKIPYYDDEGRVKIKWNFENVFEFVKSA